MHVVAVARVAEAEQVDRLSVHQLRAHLHRIRILLSRQRLGTGLLEANKDSLIAKFYGCHAIRMYGQWIYFVVMENIFCSAKKLHERYDLKGSWVNRHAVKPIKKFRGVNRFKLPDGA